MTGQVADRRRSSPRWTCSSTRPGASRSAWSCWRAWHEEVAVVAVGDGGARDIVEDGVSGVLVAQPDAGLIAAGVGSLLEDDERRRRIATAGRERLLAHFTAQRMTERMQDVLEDLRPR